jgi:hypothetical protein
MAPAMSVLTSEMIRVLRIADRDGRVIAGTGQHAGHVERVNAATVSSLLRQGLLTHTHGDEGQIGGSLTQAGREALAQGPAAYQRPRLPAQPRVVRQDVIDAWMRRLAEDARGLDFKDAEDRSTFRGLVAASMRDLKWTDMRDIAKHLGADRSSGRDATLKQITTLYMQRAPTEKKTGPQLDADIAEVLAKGAS